MKGAPTLDTPNSSPLPSPPTPHPSDEENAVADVRRVLRAGRRFTLFLGGLGGLLYLMSGLYAIEPEQRGVVFRFGRILEDEALPGIHYRLPWPIDRVERLRTTEVRTLEVAFDEPQVLKGGESDALLTGDENLLLAQLIVQYTVREPARFLVSTSDPERLLERLAREAALIHFARTGVDEALTTARQELQTLLRDDLQASSDAMALGIRVSSLQIRKIDPPSAVATAFKDVGSAREDRQKRVEEAQGERNRRLPEARGEAQRMRSEAGAAAQEAIAHARGDAERFIAAWSEYRKARAITAHRDYLEAVEAILPRVKKIVANPNAEGGGAAKPVTRGDRAAR
ncbi:MAG: FtsH protease activity modulator HflK [Myxococcales bacterium]|jgi:membrane protease subunit HflK|nr:FtsH protease activity modulator HflK [Myxococcales bacterium]